MSSPGSSSPIGRVLFLGMAEGVSFLFLLGVAMPLKYLAHRPEFVKYGGWCHGLLFILFLMAVVQAWAARQLTTRQSALAFIAAFLPFGPFFLDRYLQGVEPSGEEGL